MRKKIIVPLLAFIGLGSLVVLGSSPDFAGQMVEFLRQTSITEMFLPAKQEDDVLTKFGIAKRVPPKYKSEPVERPESLLWHVVFDFTKKMETKTEEAKQQGSEGNLFSKYFTRQGPLSDDNDQILKQIAAKDFDEIDPLDQLTRKIIEELRAEPKGNFSRFSTDLKNLQIQKDEITLRHRDEVRAAFGEEAFNKFSLFLSTDFSAGATPKKLITTTSPDSFFYDAYSWIVWDDTQQPPQITGFSELYFHYFGGGPYYDPSLDSYFINVTTSSVLDYGRGDGYRDFFPSQNFHPTFFSIRGHQYCTAAYHYADLYDGPFLVDEIYLTSTNICHIVGPAPTPTPTPTPTRTPICTPSGGEFLPSPSPSPSPSATIVPMDVVEKNGTRNINVSVLNNSGGTTRFSLRTTNGTGNATFADNSTEVVVTGNVMDQSLTIKGVTESSQADNIIIEARLNSSQTVAASDVFTVGVITSLTFARINTGDLALDENPGTDGIVNPDMSEGLRIFPDKNSPTNDPDRSILSVTATISPQIPGVKVYFASFDLDDPSTNALPVDPNGAVGNDNNGQMSMSKSGQLLDPGSGSCTAASIAADVSKIECTAIGNMATSNYKITMQPGDNFAIAASLSDIYRNGIVLNSTDGSKLANGTGQTIAISTEANPDNAAGLRTRMLTVWRRLHLEVDSMGNVGPSNNVTGTVKSTVRTLCTPQPCTDYAVFYVNTPLELHRFDNGRIIVNRLSYDVLANDASNVIVNSAPLITNIPPPNAPFTLYDDDD